MNFKELLVKLIGILNKTKIPYMFTGGIAVNYYGFTRATFDIDIVLTLEEKDVGLLVKNLKVLRFDLKTKDVLSILKISNRIISYSSKTDYRIDIWIPKTEFEKEAFKRRRKVDLFGRKIWIASAEDIILYKLLSLRGRDKEDIIGILVRQNKKIDKNYLLHWAKILDKEKEFKELFEEAEKFK